MNQKNRRQLRHLLATATWILAFLIARASLADHYHVPSGSMEPTVLTDDRIVVNKAAYGLRLPLTNRYLWPFDGPARGDVVVLESPEDGRTLLKRVVAVPADRVAFDNGRIWLNGQLMPLWTEGDYQLESLAGKTHRIRRQPDGGPDYGPAIILPNHYLVVGDNRGDSHDGRSFGLVQRSQIHGKAIAAYRRNGKLTWSPIDSSADN